MIFIREAPLFNINPKSDLVKQVYLKFLREHDIGLSKVMHKYFHLKISEGVVLGRSCGYNNRHGL